MHSKSAINESCSCEKGEIRGGWREGDSLLCLYRISPHRRCSEEAPWGSFNPQSTPEEIHFLFSVLGTWLPLHDKLIAGNTGTTGEQLYHSIEMVIEQLDSFEKRDWYEVQKILHEIRICLYYMLEEVNEINRAKKC